MAGRAPIAPQPSRETLPLEEQIRRRAYELYLERGGEDGSELDDWLQSEAEIKQEQDQSV
jgi:Protein of unknown function (DUF2934)